MKRSKAVTIALLMSSLALVGCGEDAEDVTNVINQASSQGLAFDSFEDCSVNIGPENCRKDPVTRPGSSARNGSGGDSTFLPIAAFAGGYLLGAPRASMPAYQGSSAWARTFSPSSPAAKAPAIGAVSRGGFGGTGSSSSSSS